MALLHLGLCEKWCECQSKFTLCKHITINTNTLRVELTEA